MNLKKTVTSILAGLMLAGAASAETLVSNDITTSTTWTASGNPYRLTGQIYVLPGASLTIEPGVILASRLADQGSLAVCRGAKIYVNGTESQPVIMTSENDDFTTWREVCNEWGNLTVMGNALISASHYGGAPVGSNTKMPTGLNEKMMEGLTDPVKAMYGGDDDNDDSGSIRYLSLRYGGKVIGLANELNGLSLGGIGRETDISHVEVMNNVDDGIEIWGGTVNLKYFSVWNIGDDSFDIDQGWRGKAQFGLIVQGSSVDDVQGSGVGDNAFEMDGAEDSDAQPVTTAVFYNMTVIGQPIDGDHLTAWRDNARAQFRNCIFMDAGETVVRLDNKDGDGGQGYGYNGTLSWADTWTTPYSHSLDYNASPNQMPTEPAPGAFNHPAVMYQAQTSGNLSEIRDSVFFRNMHPAAYTEATARGVFAPANNNVLIPGTDNADAPIQGITRAAPVTRGGKQMVHVTWLNPCAANEAVTSVDVAPVDGFFTPAPFRGAFSATHNWLEGWSASYQYGLVDTSMNSPAPAAAAALAKVETVTSFDTEAGVVYSVEKSTDMKSWIPVSTIVGDGSSMEVSDLDSFDSTKFYRVIKQ